MHECPGWHNSEQRLLFILQGQLFFVPHLLRHLHDLGRAESGEDVARGMESRVGVEALSGSGGGMAA